MGLTSGIGGQVQIAPGTNAPITFPVPKSLAAPTPSSIPLWFFDETIGMWKEEGTASLKAGVYKGTISRIADWNLGIPTAARAVVEGDVSCVANRAVGDVGVNIGQTKAMADENGHYRCRVPANATLPVKVIAENNGVIGAAPITIAPIGANATRVVNVTTESCPSMLEGVIVDCSNKPIAGFLQITTAQGTRLVSTSDGAFHTPIPHGEALSVIAYSLDAHLSSEVTVADVAPGDINDVGSIEVCADPRGQFTDINVGSEVVGAMTFIEGGKTLAIVSRGRVLFYDVASGTLKRSIDVSLSGKVSGGDDMLMFNQDERVMLICGASSEARVYDVATGNLLRQLGPFVEYGLLTDDGMSVIAANYSTLSRVDIATGTTVQKYSIDLRPTWQVTGYRLLGMQQGGSSFVFKVRTTGSDHLFVWDVLADSSIYDFVTYNSYKVEDFLSPNGMMYGWLTNDPEHTSASISFMELRSGTVVNTIPAVYDTSASTSYAISPNEQLFVARSSAPLGKAGLPSVRRVVNDVVEHVLALPSFTANVVGYAFDRATTMLAVSYANGKTSGNVVRFYKL